MKMAQKNPKLLATETKKSRETLVDADARRARLPLIDKVQCTDPDKGLWELWGQDTAALAKQGLRARNPADDVRDCNVAIDFGTSSTVVAYDEGGLRKLFRVGVTDFWEKQTPAHYENPTVLEFVDLPAVLKPWQTKAYRPNVLWDDVRCSHEAMQNFRNNQTDTRVVASVLTKIKQWALREGDASSVLISDQTTDIEFTFDPLTLRQPVKGQALTVSEADPFDPVELYAWFLGLTINWRGHGIHLRYYMTFPVAYPREVKEKILASFRRGLQRSLPRTLIMQPVFEKFTVEERASEPAAYAAIALQTLGIKPTQEGVAYGVFDFGGGTTDFDYGHYRLPTDTEADDEGWEQVFKHFGSGGDSFLGGENLLEHMAYLTFRHNLDLCRSSKITFSQPFKADDFPGSTMFLQRSQAATTNTLMLMALLRPIWESGVDTSKSGVQKIQLLASDGKKVQCELTVPIEDLQKFLEDRIEVGVHNFYAALKKAFADQMPATVHVLLGGNASKSRIVSGFFGLDEGRKTSEEDKSNKNQPQHLSEKTKAYIAALFGDQPPKFICHAPLPADETDMYRPTAKTGVALGLLSLCPGSPILVINHVAKVTSGEAPFLHYVGRIRLGKFHVCVQQGARYGQWEELGPVRERVFTLVYSQEPRAQSGEMKDGDIALTHKRQEFAGIQAGERVFGRAVSPHEIELCTAASLEAVKANGCQNLRFIKLT